MSRKAAGATRTGCLAGFSQCWTSNVADASLRPKAPPRITPSSSSGCARSSASRATPLSAPGQMDAGDAAVTARTAVSARQTVAGPWVHGPVSLVVVRCPVVVVERQRTAASARLNDSPAPCHVVPPASRPRRLRIGQNSTRADTEAVRGRSLQLSIPAPPRTRIRWSSQLLISRPARLRVSSNADAPNVCVSLEASSRQIPHGPGAA